MSSPFEIQQKLKMRAQKEAGNEALRELVAVLSKQADAMERSRRSAWWTSVGSLVVATGSLATAILALVLR